MLFKDLKSFLVFKLPYRNFGKMKIKNAKKILTYLRCHRK